MAETTPIGLVRGIRRRDLVALSINVVVGASIFGLPSKVYSRSGSGSLIAYAICAAAITLIGLCFAEVGSRFTETGGPYLYARQAFGPVVGFEVGWLRWLSGVLAFAANSNLFADYLGYIAPILSTGPGRRLVITVVILLLAAINIAGVRHTAIASNIFVVGKLLPLVLFVAVGLFFVDPHRLAITAQPSYAGLSTSVFLLTYAFSGFEVAGIPAGEARDPRRGVPIALLTTIGVVTLLYVSIQVVCIGTLPDLGSSTRPLADASSGFLGTSGGYIISAAAIISITGNLNGTMLAATRMIFAMAEQKQLPQPLAVIHNQFHTPHYSILWTAGVILGFALSGTFVQLLTVSVITRVIVYFTTCAALPVLRRSLNGPPAAFRIPAGFFIATASVAICCWLLSNSTSREAWITGIAGGAGLLVYFLHRRVSRRGAGVDPRHTWQAETE